MGGGKYPLCPEPTNGHSADDPCELIICDCWCGIEGTTCMEHWPKCAAECGQGIFQQIFYLAKGIVWDTGLGDCTGNVGILKCVGKTSKGLWEGGIEFLGHAKDYFCGVTDTEIVKDTVYCSEFSSDVFKYVGETGECIK